MQSSIISLTSELKGLREQFEESLTSHERELKSLHEQIRETGKHREAALREVRAGGPSAASLTKAFTFRTDNHGLPLRWTN